MLFYRQFKIYQYLPEQTLTYNASVNTNLDAIIVNHIKSWAYAIKSRKTHNEDSSISHSFM